MENNNIIEKLASQFGQSASVKNVFGDPVHAGDKTIIPVAQIAFGLGGGHGRGKGKNKIKNFEGSRENEMKDSDGQRAEGSGGGGGMFARPKGVYEITSTGTRFIPADNTRPLIIGLALGFILRGWLHSRKKIK